jgi:hypothetical protein
MHYNLNTPKGLFFPMTKHDCENLTFERQADDAQQMTRWPYTQEAYQRRERFVQVLTAACLERCVELHWLDHEKWNASLCGDGREALLSGYVFPVNPATTS